MTIVAPLSKGESIPMLKDLSGNGVTMAWSDPVLPTVSKSCNQDHLHLSCNQDRHFYHTFATTKFTSLARLEQEGILTATRAALALRLDLWKSNIS